MRPETEELWYTPYTLIWPQSSESHLCCRENVEFNPNLSREETQCDRKSWNLLVLVLTPQINLASFCVSLLHGREGW
jgi:hypothetical protein